MSLKTRKRSGDHSTAVIGCTIRLRTKIPKERLVEITWQGPFLLNEKGKLARHPMEPKELPNNSPGLYILTGDHPLYGPHTLLYIGMTDRLASVRIMEHQWIREEWRVEVYVAECGDEISSNMLKDIERVLIYIHSPPYNALSIGKPPRLKTPLRIWNVGRFWRLYPEISSMHDWSLP